MPSCAVPPWNSPILLFAPFFLKQSQYNGVTAELPARSLSIVFAPAHSSPPSHSHRGPTYKFTGHHQPETHYPNPWSQAVWSHHLQSFVNHVAVLRKKDSFQTQRLIWMVITQVLTMSLNCELAPTQGLLQQTLTLIVTKNVTAADRTPKLVRHIQYY